MTQLHGLIILCVATVIILFILWKTYTPNIETIKLFINNNGVANIYIGGHLKLKYHDFIAHNFTDSKQKLDFNNIKSDDPLLIAEIRNNYLIPPVSSDLKYVLKHPGVKDPSAGQTAIIRKALKDMRNGFFVECGAVDGEMFSNNTLALERDLGWTGLLVEANPVNVQAMLNVNRKAWIAPTCLSQSVKPSLEYFRTFKRQTWGRIPGTHKGYPNEGVLPTDLKLQCIPLYSFLLALNRTTIDFLSLDVEGTEFSILQTIPFDKVNITTITVEHKWITQKKDDLFRYIIDQGYKLISNYSKGKYAGDFIFIKNYY